MQLIDLRTVNYSLESEKKKQVADIKRLENKVQSLEDELNRANKTINKSKKLKEIDTIFAENDSLLRKLQCQEDEFSLQNATLMQELSLVIANNEKYEKQIQECEKNTSFSDGANDAEICHLKAENLVLQKCLNETREKSESTILDLEVQLSTLQRNLSSEDSHPLESNSQTDLITDYQDKIKRLKAEVFDLTDENMKVEMREEENKNLVDQLKTLKLSEKLKKKQESLVQLQQEKEKMYHENKISYEEMIHSKDTEIIQLKEMTCRLQVQLNGSLDASQDHKKKSALAVQELEKKCAQLQIQVEELNESNPDKIKVLEEEATRLKSSAETAWIERDNQIRALKGALAKNEVQTQSFHLLENAKAEVDKNYLEVTNLAEKRKSLLDQMAVHLQSLTEKYSVELKDCKENYESKIEELSKSFDEEKKKNVRIEKMKNELEAASQKLKSLESSKGWLERRLQEVQDEIENNRCRYEEQNKQMLKQHETELEDIQKNHQVEIAELNVQIELIKVQKVEFEEAVVQLKQDIVDSFEDRKIQEKKGLGIVKDFKRQLHSEKRLVEKLQERMQELLKEHNQSHTSVDELLSGNHSDRHGDNGSVGSWSMMSGGTLDNSNLGKDIIPPQSVSSSNENDLQSNQNISSTMEQEYHELIARLAEVQQQKWDVEEKLNHLEISNSAMAEDLMVKTSIIQHYCMEGRPDPQPLYSSSDKLTVKRVVDFIKDKGDENLREINRKLQRMLEETLTKNMHLQKNLESLSKQLVSINKTSTNQSV
ncbi:GRIP1-associated protein 1 [Nymphon striatum]|nr:GRIP1-associated protein 1 [Nymphon striatum]